MRLSGWKQTLTRPELPVVNVGSKLKPVYIPPELCTVIAGQIYFRNLSDTQTRRILPFAVQKPERNRSQIINQGLDVIGLSPKHRRPVSNVRPFREVTLTARETTFGLQTQQEMMKVDARILNPPQVVYSNKAQAVVSNGGWNLRNMKFLNGRTLPKWSILRPKDHPAITDVNKLMENLRKCGMLVKSPSPLAGFATEFNDEGSLRKTFIAIIAQDIQLVWVILPSTDEATVARIKSLADQELGECPISHPRKMAYKTTGIHTVCSQSKKIMELKGSGKDQYFANEAMKLNLKWGGANQALASMGEYLDGKSMMVGIDVTHPPSAKVCLENSPSIAGVVASVDGRYAQWPGSIRLQKGRQEIVEELQAIIEERLALWQIVNAGALPEKIIVYRDGVSNGQYIQVRRLELKRVFEACKKFYSANQVPMPKISFIIVSKRHHTRFYPTNANDADKNGNPKPGTIVDRGVTSDSGWDFFLIAHSAIQGTAKPAHYFVIHDGVGIGVDGLEQLVRPSKT